MSLARVQVLVTEFDYIYEHLTTHKPPYTNMHMREMCQKDKKRVLRYLHAMVASTARSEIEGMISGPDVFWHYKLIGGQHTQLRVLEQEAATKDVDRIQRRFLPEVLKRIGEEHERKEQAEEVFPKLTAGQFYLRRSRPGMQSSHVHCRAAVQSGALDKKFVARLREWELALLHPA